MLQRAIPENREFKKCKFNFFYQRHALSTSFDIFVVTYRVTNFLPKLVNMLLFSREKTKFPFFGFPLFSGYALQCKGGGYVHDDDHANRDDNSNNNGDGKMTPHAACFQPRGLKFASWVIMFGRRCKCPSTLVTNWPSFRTERTNCLFQIAQFVAGVNEPLDLRFRSNTTPARNSDSHLYIPFIVAIFKPVHFQFCPNFTPIIV